MLIKGGKIVLNAWLISLIQPPNPAAHQEICLNNANLLRITYAIIYPILIWLAVFILQINTIHLVP
jgi:hypothetical protein